MTYVARGIWLRVCLAGILPLVLGVFSGVDTTAQVGESTTDELIIRGEVRDHGHYSLGLSGARVVLTVSSSDSNSYQIGPLSTVTGDDGRFSFPGFLNTGGRLTVVATIDGYQQINARKTFDLSDTNYLRDARNVILLTLRRIAQPVPSSATMPQPMPEAQDGWWAKGERWLFYLLVFLIAICVVALIGWGVMKAIDRFSGTQSETTSVQIDNRSSKSGARTTTAGNQALDDEAAFRNKVERQIKQLTDADEILRQKLDNLRNEFTNLEQERKSSPGSSFDPSRAARGGIHRLPDQADQRGIFVECYNKAMAHPSAADRKQIFEQSVEKTIVMGVANFLERRKASGGRDIDPVYETSEAGSYLLIQMPNDVYYGVPILHQPITRNEMDGGAMGLVFDCKDYTEGEKQRVALKKPAEFSKKDQNLWHLEEKGILTFSNE